MLEFLVTLIVKSDGYLLLIIAIFFHMFRALCFFKYYTIAIELKSKVKMQYVESKYIYYVTISYKKKIFFAILRKKFLNQK